MTTPDGLPARLPVPPFDEATARQKVHAAEDAWNTRDPQRVAAAYTADSQWRNRSEFVRGRAEIVAFLTRKWQREQDYALSNNLWAFTADRIAVRFQYEWHDDTGQCCAATATRTGSSTPTATHEPSRGQHQRRAHQTRRTTHPRPTPTRRPDQPIPLQ